MNLCEYKNIFAKPNEGIHSLRLFGFAVVDIIMTIVAALLISYFFKFSIGYTLLFLFALGIILHKMFCIQTTLNKIIFEN